MADRNSFKVEAGSELDLWLEQIERLADQMCQAVVLPGSEAEVVARVGAGLAALVGSAYESDHCGHLGPIRQLSAIITAWVESRPDPTYPGVTVGESEAFGRN